MGMLECPNVEPSYENKKWNVSISLCKSIRHFENFVCCVHRATDSIDQEIEIVDSNNSVAVFVSWILR